VVGGNEPFVVRVLGLRRHAEIGEGFVEDGAGHEGGDGAAGVAFAELGIGLADRDEDDDPRIVDRTV